MRLPAGPVHALRYPVLLPLLGQGSTRGGPKVASCHMSMGEHGASAGGMHPPTSAEGLHRPFYLGDHLGQLALPIQRPRPKVTAGHELALRPTLAGVVEGNSEAANRRGRSS